MAKVENYENLNGFKNAFPRKKAIAFLEKLKLNRGFGLENARYFVDIEGGEDSIELNYEFPGFFEGDFEELRKEVLKYRSWKINISEEGEGLLYIAVTLSRREKG